jgi:hypothetical protein
VPVNAEDAEADIEDQIDPDGLWNDR